MRPKLRRQSTTQPIKWHELTKKQASEIRLREISNAMPDDLCISIEVLKGLRPIVRRAISKKQMIRMDQNTKAFVSQHLIKPDIDQITTEELNSFTPELIHSLTAEELAMFSTDKLWHIPENIIVLLRKEQKMMLSNEQKFATDLRLNYHPNFDKFNSWDMLPCGFAERLFDAPQSYNKIPAQLMKHETYKKISYYAGLLKCY